MKKNLIPGQRPPIDPQPLTKREIFASVLVCIVTIAVLATFAIIAVAEVTK